MPKVTLAGGGINGNPPTRNAVVHATVYNQRASVVVDDVGAGYRYEGNPTFLTVTVTIDPPDPNGETFVWSTSGIVSITDLILNHIEWAVTMSKKTNQSVSTFVDPVWITNFIIPNCTIETTLPDYNPTAAVAKWNPLGTAFFLMNAWLFRIHDTGPWTVAIQQANEGFYPGPLGYVCTNSAAGF